jgi:hypothetical protein
MLKRELPVLVNEWGSEFALAWRVPPPPSCKVTKRDADADPAVTSCKLFMTYAAMQLRDNEILDVMYEARKLAVTTVSGSTPVRLFPNAAHAGTPLLR